MKTKTIYLFMLISSAILFISCNTTKSTKEEGDTLDSLNTSEIVKRNALKYFFKRSNEDSLNHVTLEVLVIDSFTLKDNIDYRRTQIIDSIENTANESKIKYYKNTLNLLDSIEKFSVNNLNEIISYYYQFTKHSASPTISQTIGSKNETSSSSTTVYFYTDATRNREIIWMTEDEKNLIQNPYEYPNYYKKIDRYEKKN